MPDLEYIDTGGNCFEDKYYIDRCNGDVFYFDEIFDTIREAERKLDYVEKYYKKWIKTDNN